MRPAAQLLSDVREIVPLYEELLEIIEKEGRLLRDAEPASLFEIYQRKKTLLPELDGSLRKLRLIRSEWLALSVEERNDCPDFAPLLRQAQALLMRMILIDRENEQGLLRRGLVPAREIPAAQRQRPHFVADLYRRQTNV